MVKIRPLVWLGLGAFLWQCGPKESTFVNAPIIFISIDTLRSDRLPVYGYDTLKTPAFDALAKDGVLFERAYAHVPLTLPSHSSMFTGLLPPNHGVRDNTGYALDQNLETLAEILKDAGYATGGVISGMVLRQSTGISQGFDFYDDQLDTQSKDQIRRYAYRRGDASVLRAQEWLTSQTGSQPPFLFLHLYDPHTPYEAPEPFASAYRHPYDAEIAYVDSLLDGFFQFLKDQNLYDRSLIILTSDHGEGLGEHGEDEHGIFAYRESIQVPLIVKFPQNHRAGEVRTQPVASIDLMPSILQTTGLPLKTYDGVPIFGIKSPPQDRPIYAETLSPLNSFGWCASKGVIRDNLHYIQICDPELYDLEEDPGSLQNLIGKVKVPKAILDTLEDLGEGKETTAEASAAELELLASLGYAGGAVGITSDKILDPHNEIKVFKELDNVRVLLDAKQWEAVIAALVPILERNPALSDGRYMLIQALTEQGKIQEAEFATLEGLGLFPNHLNFLLALTTQKLRRNLVEEAKTAATKAFSIDADTAGAQLLLPLYEAGASEMAVFHANQLLSNYSDSSLSAPYAYFVAGRDARQQGNYPKAVELLQRGLALRDRVHRPETLGYAHQALGDSLARMDRLPEALDQLQKAVELAPSSATGRVALSYVYASMNRPREALTTLETWINAYPQRANLERAAQALDTMGFKSQAATLRKAAAQAEE